MTVYNVSNSTQFNAAIAQAQGGDSIVLASGNYGSLTIQNKNFSSYVTVQAASGASVHFDGLSVLSSKNLSFAGIDVGRTLNAGEPEWTRMGDVRDSSNLKFDNMKFHGSLDGDPSNDGYGLYATNVSGLSVTNTEFTELYRGTAVQTSTNVRLANNDFHLIRSDGVIGYGTDNIMIDGNSFSNFHPVLGDHADAIQFFNTNLTKGASNITIQNNVVMQTYYSGVDTTGLQGFFISDGGDAGYKNVLIQNNLLYSNNQYNGIMVTDATGVQIIGNSTVSDSTDSKQLWIRLDTDSQVVLKNNVADNIVSSNVLQLFQDGNVNFNVTPALRVQLANLLHPTDVHDLILPGAGYHVPTPTTTAPVSNALGSGIDNLISAGHGTSVGSSAVTAAIVAKSTVLADLPAVDTGIHLPPAQQQFGWHFDSFVAIA